MHLSIEIDEELERHAVECSLFGELRASDERSRWDRALDIAFAKAAGFLSGQRRRPRRLIDATTMRKGQER